MAGTMIREVARDCFDSLMLDVWPRMAAVVDFGLDSTAHYAVLQHAIRNGATVEELDAALGDGAKLNALVARFPGSGYSATFRTAYDDMMDDD